MKRFKRWFYTVALCLIVGVGLACAVACKDEAPEHTHAFISEVEAVAPTCDKAGEIVRFCSCGFTSTVSLAPLGHDTARFAEQAATIPMVDHFSASSPEGAKAKREEEL